MTIPRTCVYGHRWTQGSATCPTCGMRAVGTPASLTPQQEEAQVMGKSLVLGCVIWLAALVGLAIWAVFG